MKDIEKYHTNTKISYNYEIPCWRGPHYIQDWQNRIEALFNGLKLEPLIAN